MNIKEELEKIKETLLKKVGFIPEGSTEVACLDAKVDEFVLKYAPYSLRKQKTLRNLIEKMAVWYELRYPDYEINRLIPYTNGQTDKKINDAMFNDNRYINTLFAEDDDVRAIDWADFYNTHAFMDSLPDNERVLFKKPKYPMVLSVMIYNYKDYEIYYIDFSLTPNGIVEEADNLERYTAGKIKDSEVKGMHVKEVVQLLKEKAIVLPRNNELEMIVNRTEKLVSQKEEMLDCVMYRIIERGSTSIGPRRAFLFAKEFGRNIDIPMMYGVSCADEALGDFVLEYLKEGGSKDLECYVDYFPSAAQTKRLDTIALKDLQRYRTTLVTEKDLQQRLVNALATQITKEEEVKQLRIKRKIEKSNNIKK